MVVLQKPTGNIIQGHVLDVKLKPFERALKAHDSYLYVKWNPTGMYGWGNWEIRRRPETKTIIDYAFYEGVPILRLGYHENDFNNLILRCAFLNYDQLRKIKEMDMRGKTGEDYNRLLERTEMMHERIKKDQRKQNQKYIARHYKKEMRKMREFVLAGGNPNLVAGLMDTVTEDGKDIKGF